MCVIISIYNNKKNNRKQEFLVENLFKFNAWNGDGTAFYGFDTDKETKNGYMRELKTTGEDIFNDLLEKYNILHFHFRNATQGMINKNNIHFWKFKNWIMAHNGQVWGYDETQDIFSDSQLLFRDLAKAGCFEKDFLDINRINRIVSEKHFWGRLIFINTENKQAYYFGDFYLSVLEKEILIISTAPLKHNDLILYGLQFKTENAEFIEGKIDGIFRIDAKKQATKRYKLPFNQQKEENAGGYYDDRYISRQGWRTGNNKKQGEFLKI